MEGSLLTSMFGNRPCQMNNEFFTAPKGASNKPPFLLFPAAL